jgi:hypothetical protein
MVISSTRMDEYFIVNGQPIIMTNLNEDRKSKLFLKRMLSECDNDVKRTSEMSKIFVKHVLIEYGVHLHGKQFRLFQESNISEIINNLNDDEHLDIIHKMIDFTNIKALVRIEQCFHLLRTFQDYRNASFLTDYVEENKDMIKNTPKKTCIVLTNGY